MFLNVDTAAFVEIRFERGGEGGGVWRVYGGFFVFFEVGNVLLINNFRKMTFRPLKLNLKIFSLLASNFNSKSSVSFYTNLT